MSLAVYLDGAEIVGSFGAVVAEVGYSLFGYVVYLIPLPLFFFTYKLYKDFTYTQRKAEIAAASLLLLIAALIFQDIVTNYKISRIGSAFVDVFFPVIGTVGIAIIILGLMVVASLIIFETTTYGLSLYLSQRFRKEETVVSESGMQKREGETSQKRTLIEEDLPEYDARAETLPESTEEPGEAEVPAEKQKGKGHHSDIDAEESVSAYLERQISQLMPVDEESIVEDLEAKRKLFLSLQAGQEPHIVQKEDAKADEEEKLAREIKEIEEIERIVGSIEKASGKEEPQPPEESPTSAVPEAAEPLPKNDVKIVKELEENKRLLDDIDVGEKEKPKDFMLPKLEFLEEPKQQAKTVNEAEIDAKIEDLLEKLKMFKIEGDVVRTYSGPVVTTFEFKPAPHIKVSKILNLQDDIAMALKALTIRIQAPIPGKDVVGIEIPNDNVETIYLRDVLESDIFNKASSPLTIALGKDIVGNPFITDLKKLPHLLIAGTTGSGKSVGINAMILSLLYRNSPDELKLLMVDPKMLEFSIYNDIPHLLTPVITKPKQAIAALANMVREMERRYYLMSQTRTKNIENYNEKAKKEGFPPFPYIVVVIDELADLMMTGGKEVEVSIARLAQMARASGIHLIIATQRPSVDVITGLIKANLPSRISYRVGQKVDSKVILDVMGAESLLGRGDMLFTPPGSVGLVRLHAPWSSEKEIEKIVDFLKSQREADYDHRFLAADGEGGTGSSSGGSDEFDDELDELYEEAKEIVYAENKTSISYLQRRLQIGYNRAARIVEQLEKTGILSEQNAKGQREIVG